MPAVAIGVGAYVAGLLLGFGDIVVLGWLVVGLLLVRGLAAADRTAIAAGLILTAGFATARATVRDDRHCLDVLQRRKVWRAVLDQSGSEGGFVSAHAWACHAELSLSVNRGHGTAGDLVLVVGQATRTALGGLLVQHATIRNARAYANLPRWREEAALRVDRVFGGDAPQARALLLADKREIPAVMRDRYAAAGVAHLLAISGFHVVLIAMALRLVLQLLRVARGRTELCTLLCIIGYVALIGAPAGAVRAVVMLAGVMVSRRAQRPISPWTILSLGALAPLVDPRAVIQVGYLLSVAGVAALIASSALTKRFAWLREAHQFPHRLTHALLASVVATVVTAPLVAWTFGRLSLVGPVVSLAAVPVLAALQPMLFLGVVASPVMPLARFFADAAHPLVWLFDQIATFGAGIPGGSITITPSTSGALVAAVFSIALLIACVSRRPARPAIVALVALAILAWAPGLPEHDPRTELHMIDVGQGDALALRTTRGHWVLIDAGRIWRGGDAGGTTVVPYIAHRGGALSAFILSHPHDDHVGGATTVLHALHPRDYYDAAYAKAGLAYRASLREAQRDGIAWHRVHPDDSLVVDEVTIHFLGPDSLWTSRLHDANEASTIALICVGQVRMLLVGDAERGEEDWLLRRDSSALQADVLKVGHHGSATSTTPAFLRAVSPRVALVSVGAGNTYGHPSADVMHRLAAAGAQVLRTDRLSTVVVRTDGHTLEVEAGGMRWTIPPTRRE